MMDRREQRLTAEPCIGCGQAANERKDAFWRMCCTCSFGWLWLGEKPPLLPEYPRETQRQN
jgi:hypothetical protein